MGWTLHDWLSGIASGLQGGLAPKDGKSTQSSIFDCLKWYVYLEGFLWEAEPPPLVLDEDHLEYKVEDLIWHCGHGGCQYCLVL